QRTDVEPDAQFPGQRAEGGERAVVLLASDGGEQDLAVELHDRGLLGRLDVVGALAGGVADQRRGVFDVGVVGARGLKLDAGRGEAWRGRHAVSRRASSRPSRSSAWSSSEPPTWSSSMKICGT